MMMKATWLFWVENWYGSGGSEESWLTDLGRKLIKQGQTRPWLPKNSWNQLKTAPDGQKTAHNGSKMELAVVEVAPATIVVLMKL